MINLKQYTQARKPLWVRLPKWLLPFAVIICVALVFFIAQYAASLLLSIYAVLRGWNVVYANTWLNNSVTAQFIYILLAETFTVGQIYFILRFYGKSLATIGLKKIPSFKDGWFALLGYPVYILLYIILLAIFRYLFPSININQTQHIGFSAVHGNYQLIVTFFSLVVLPPIAEEILFRGILFEGLKKAMPVVYAAILTSILFASAHLPEGGASGPLWVGAIDTFSLSLVLVFLKQKTNNLWPSIFLHAIKNLVAFISLFLLTSR